VRITGPSCVTAISCSKCAAREPLRVTARTRYHQTEQAATVYPAENGFRLEFDQPQRAPTPGQSVVLYQGDVVLGGGIITRVEK
jgi:tRNA-specific 2-thiouridylase